jgi:SAM-dependent methyltransferase
MRQLLLDLGQKSGSPLQVSISRLRRLLDPVSAHDLSAEEKGTLEKLDALVVGKSVPDVDPCPGDWCDELVLASTSNAHRRRIGQFLTPFPIVRRMARWVADHAPDRVVDAGCASGRFAGEVARLLPEATVLAIDSDPLAALLCRARMADLGLNNVTVRHDDFLRTDIHREDGERLAFIGNPPYVRHHKLSPDDKDWAARAARSLDIPFSRLAGLHVYFFLKTALCARHGDVGCYITSAEWMDVNYGETLRVLLPGVLGAERLDVLHDTEAAFDGAMTTAAICFFRVGSAGNTITFSSLQDVADPDSATRTRTVDVSEHHGPWGSLLQGDPAAADRGPSVRLGDLVDVHRGLVTGANAFFVMSRSEAQRRGLTEVVTPVIRSGKTILEADGEVRSESLPMLLTLPKDARAMDGPVGDAIQRYLHAGEAEDIPEGYICRHRRPWWYLGQPDPPPIVASYMARRPPAFALNPDNALILNIAHGLFPKIPFEAAELRQLVAMLNALAPGFIGQGRTYQGGLEKFEPSEMQNLKLPVSAFGDFGLADLTERIHHEDTAEAHRQ